MMPIIRVSNLEFKYSNDRPNVLSSVNMEIKENKITALAGLSGCGKSTLAYCLSGIIPKSIPGVICGDILFDGININHLTLPEISKNIGIVFQEPDNQLFLPTVESEIAFAPENYRLPYDEIDFIIKKTLTELNIEHLRFKNPANLSGGEKHLVAIASVLAMNPKVLILDEVMTGLDEKNKNIIINTIKRLQELGKTIIFIDHNIDNLMIADYIYLVKNKKIDMVLKGDISNELLFNKLNDFFLSQI